MNAASETLAAPVAATPATRPFYWSVRRELWEHRALFIAPLVAAAVVLAGVMLNAMHLPEGSELLGTLSPVRARAAVYAAFSGAAFAVSITLAVVAWFYSLDALQGERRDRSVLFWKSMPISDLTTVLSKLAVPMVVVPAIAFAVTIVTQLLMLVIGAVIVLGSGHSFSPVWGNLQFFQQSVVLLYALIVASLWYAPITAWLLLVSSWAKRSTFLWAVLPPIAVVVFERVAFGTGYAARLIGYRMQDGLATAFNLPHGKTGVIDGKVHLTRDFPEHVMDLMNPAGFLSNVHLWTGLAVAAALIAGAVWMRRYREPI